MKTIGVFGGLGPQATMDFERLVHDAAARLIPPHFNAGYPPMLVWYCRHAPFIVDASGRPIPPLRPDPRLLDAARHLGAAADFLVIPSNGAHVLRPQVEQAAGKPVLSMIDTTIGEIRRRHWQRVGVLGLGPPLVYTEPLGALGITCETLAPDQRAPLDAAIFRVMEHRPDDAGRGALRAALSDLRARTVDGIVLGCTELPLLVAPDELETPDVINPIALLAEAAVRHSLGEGA